MRHLPAVCLVLLASLVAGLLGTFDVYSNDVGFHLAYGRWSVEHRAVPETPTLSDRFGDRFWHDDKWLFQVGLALVDRAGGWRAMAALRLVLTLALWTILVAAGGRRRPVSTAAIGVLTLVATSERLLLRPELVSFVFLALFVVVIDRYLSDPDGRVRWLVGLVPLLIVWVNVHSYWIFGLVLLWGTTGGRLIAARWRREGPLLGGSRRPLLLVSIGASLGAFVSPQPLWGVYFPLYALKEILVGGHDPVRDIVTEYEPAWRIGSFVASTHVAYGLLLGVAVLCLLQARRRARLEEWAFVLLFLVGSLPLRRNIALFAVVAGTIALCLRRRDPGAVGRRVLVPAGALVAAGLLVLAASLTSNRLHQHDRRPRRLGLSKAVGVYPDRAADYILEHDLPGPYFNDFNIGGHLLLRLGRDREPYIDGNMGTYPLEHFFAYHDVMRGKVDLGALCGDQGIRFFVLSIARSDTAEVLRRLDGDRRFALVHLDPVAAIYVLVEGPADRPDRIDLDALEAATPLTAGPDVPAPPSALSWLDPRPAPDAIEAIRLAEFFDALDGRSRLARRYYLEAIEAGVVDIKVLTQLGAVELELERPAEARPWLAAAVALRPGYPVARFYLGRALLALGEADEAAAELARATEIDPERPELETWLGHAEAERGRLDAASAAYRRALALRPGDGQALLGLSAIHSARGEQEAALRLLDSIGFDEAPALRAAALHEKGRIHRSAGRPDMARRCFLEASQLDLDNPVYRQALREIEGE